MDHRIVETFLVYYYRAAITSIWEITSINSQKKTMARKKQGLHVDIMNITSRLPWWVGLLLALAAYYSLHHFASKPIANVATEISFVDQIGSTFIRSLSAIGQYVLPMVFVFGAIASVLRRCQRQNMFDQANQETGRAAIQAMSWDEFELLIAEVFRQKGYTIAERSGHRADSEVDLTVTKNNKAYLIQCKHWRTNKVGVVKVKELYAVMMANRVQAGMVVTSGTFTQEARQFAQDKPINLLDGVAVYQLIRSVKPESATISAAHTTPYTPER